MSTITEELIAGLCVTFLYSRRLFIMSGNEVCECKQNESIQVLRHHKIINKGDFVIYSLLYSVL
jgi:hypothetical protein